MPIVLGGFSQGGGVAVTLAIDGTGFPAHGFVAVAPAFSGIGHPQTDTSEAARRGVRGIVIVGEDDPYRPEGEEVQGSLAASGVVCDLVVEPGIAHVIPPRFESRLEAALDVILHDGRPAKPSNVSRDQTESRQSSSRSFNVGTTPQGQNDHGDVVRRVIKAG